MATERVLVTVKTYPTLSSKYGELVCTAGVREDGSWVRIYPVPFRRLKDYYRFHKYSWIELALEKNRADNRPESFRPVDLSRINIHPPLGTTDKWAERKEIMLERVDCYEDMKELIAKAHSNELSLALFKPGVVEDFVWEKTERKWDKRKLNKVMAELRQGHLFYPEEFIQEFKVAKKLPYKFSYVFSDRGGRKRKLMLEDWEVGALYWNCLARCNDEDEALRKVKEKYFDTFTRKTDLHFYLGTTSRYHRWSKNPFVVIGTFTPPIDHQPRLEFAN